MNSQNNTWVWVALVAVAIIAIVALFSPQAPNVQVAGNIDGPTTYGKVGTEQLKVGSGCASGFKYGTCTGTAVNKLLQGTCSLSQMTPGSFAASTTQIFFCPVTGVVANDFSDVTLPSGAGTPASPGEGFHLVSAFATTTGILAVTISNDTGAATSSFKQATSSVSYFITN